MRRRDFVRLAGAAAIALPSTGRAQFNASRPITMIVPFPAGGGADILVRMLTKYMSENLSHSIIVQNLPGAGGGLAFGQVARAAPDGHTLGWVSTGFPVMAATLSNLTFKPESDFVHICNVSENPFVLVVNPQVPVKSVKELVDLGKARPNSLNFAHNGAATLTNLVVMRPSRKGRRWAGSSTARPSSSLLPTASRSATTSRRGRPSGWASL